MYKRQFLEDVPPDLMPQLKGAKGVSLKSYGKNSNMFTLRMNWLQPPFNNVKVRRAALAALSEVDYLDAQIGDPEIYPVSYTHLDVYKRQHITRPLSSSTRRPPTGTSLPAGVVRSLLCPGHTLALRATCLLYTSRCV